MPQDMKVWRKNARHNLIVALGGKCVDCGEGDESKLEFDHIMPLTEEQDRYRRDIGSNKRMVLFRKEATEGLIELRCKRCNTRKSKEPKQGTLSFSTVIANYANMDIPF